MYEARNYRCAVIHSNLDEEEKSDIKRQLKSGELDCIVQVQMLGEGFDHPKLSVAAIFRPYRTLSPYIQFVGRILRVIVQNNPEHPDNHGHIVTHAGMNIDQRREEFKLFENDDQKFWESVLSCGEEPELPSKVSSGAARMRLSEKAFANSEIVDSLIEEDFSTAEDADIIRELEIKLESLGLDPSSARSLFENKSSHQRMSPAAQPFPILPQKEWEQLRKDLSTQVKRTANLLLNRLEILPSDRELVNAGIPANNNIIAGITIINKELKKSNPKDRKLWSIEEFRNAHDALEGILNSLTTQYKGILSAKSKR
jgi:superfamily II DNA or RNA helicase